MKISILLPYKENYSPNSAGAVSLYVKDTTIKSLYKNHISIFGNTNYKKKLSSNYTNLELNKKFYESTSKQYVHSFLNHLKQKNSEVIEIHNRPNYIKYFDSVREKKIILYFHNDPLTMNGSKTIKQRKFLLNKVDNIIFNSIWSKNRFFIGIKDNDHNKFKINIIYQSAAPTKVNFKKKEKIISFIGKLNKAKGYDLFGETIIKILNKYPDWNAVVIGDEKREKLIYKHKNLKILGFKDNIFILNFLKKVSISVVCSKWNEPFGRTSLEAASRGSAVIISNRGGLPETTSNALILKNLTHNELYNKIEKLILNSTLRKKYQINNYKNFTYTNKYITALIDNIRKRFISFINKKNININKNTKLKIIHITNFNERHNGRLHYNTGRRLNNGFIRLGHNVLTISDRDILHKNKSINDLNGYKNLNKKIVESYKNFKPDIIILGHADGVDKNCLKDLKDGDCNLKIGQWFLDPLSKLGPDFNKNKKRILDKDKILDASFLTTEPNSLPFKIHNPFFIPNPCDKSFEILNNYENDCQNDLFFAMSHGVHRGKLKRGKIDDREIFINKLLKYSNNIKFDIYGMNNIQPIWGNKFIENIANSSMGLNLSRGKPIKYYSSDRLAQLIGNGLLTFVDVKTKFNDFFSDNEMIFYNNINDLKEKIMKYKKDKKKRIQIAKNGKFKYFKYFNSDIVSNYVLTRTIGNDSKQKYIWDK